MFQQLFGVAVPASLRGPVLLDGIGLPRYWAAVWSTMAASELADSTHTKKLRYLEDLYQHAADLISPNALDDALSDLDADALAQILESWFVSIRNQPVVTGADEKRWQTGLEFVSSVVTWLSKSEAVDDRLQRIEQRLNRLSGLYSQLHVRRDKAVEMVRSLPASTVEALYLLLDPNSPQNPFAREQTRWRVSRHTCWQRRCFDSYAVIGCRAGPMPTVRISPIHFPYLLAMPTRVFVLATCF
ncbi:MAG: hypothetical protein M3O74_26410 [Pseudomonadota bacterium]|nr:hypothetical protein [Pseudomonadota bacterium]